VCQSRLVESTFLKIFIINMSDTEGDSSLKGDKEANATHVQAITGPNAHQMMFTYSSNGPLQPTHYPSITWDKILFPPKTASSLGLDSGTQNLSHLYKTTQVLATVSQNLSSGLKLKFNSPDSCSVHCQMLLPLCSQALVTTVSHSNEHPREWLHIYFTPL